MERMEVNVEVWEMKEGKITAFKKDDIIYKTEIKEAEEKPEETKQEPTKTCTRCKTEKPVFYFNKNKSSPDGYQYWCKQCLREHEQQKRENKKTKAKKPKPKKKREKKLTTREKHWAKQIIEKYNDGVFHRKEELYDFVHKKIPYVQRQSMQVMVSRILKTINKNTKYNIETKRDPDDPKKYLFKLTKIVPDIKISNGSLPLTQPDTTDRKKINWNKFRWK